MKKPLQFAHLVGDGIGIDYEKAMHQLLTGLKIPYEAHRIDNFRLPNGEMDPAVLKIFKLYGVSIKGPTRTPMGPGARSVNVALRLALDLYANVRPAFYIAGVDSPVKNPELLNVTTFRENTEDIYTGIEWASGSDEAKKFKAFLLDEMHVDHSLLMSDRIGFGVKHISEEGSARIARYAMAQMIAKGGGHLAIMNKSNIMKYTEGLFKDICLHVAKTEFADQVWGKELGIPDSAGKALHISCVTADDLFQQILLQPKKFTGIVSTNLNGDYISDAAAAIVGGVALAAGANVGKTHAMFEGIGGTADDIAGKDTANPTPFFIALAMMFEHAGYEKEGKKIRGGVAGALQKGYGTADICKENALSTSDFTDAVIEDAFVDEFVATN